MQARFSLISSETSWSWNLDFILDLAGYELSKDLIILKTQPSFLSPL